MGTRLHALGFPAAWTADIAATLTALAAQSRLVETPRGSYRHWRSREGAELWFHFPDNLRSLRHRLMQTQADSGSPPVDTITPFHRGQSSIKVRIGRVLARDRANPLEGSCLAWLPKTADGWREQTIVMELVPFARHVMKPPPFEVEAQITCFAHALWAFDNADSYRIAATGPRRIEVGAYAAISQADVPEVGMIYRHEPITLGLATGRVKRAIRLTNPVTHAPYYWVALETKRGVFDVLVNPDVVHGDISEGHVAQVCGSFVARLAGTPV